MKKHISGFPENAIVTGGSRGIGRAIAEALASKGTNLLINARNDVRLAAACLEMEAQFPDVRILGFAADLGTAEKADALAQLAAANFEHVDLLVNNAGAFQPGAIEDEPPGRLQELLNANLFTAYHLSRAIVGRMKKRGSGHIINICSVAGMKAYSGGGSYGIAKFALNGFSQNLREELKDHGVKVTTVFPGATLTDSWEGVDIPPERFMSPEDVAVAVVSMLELSNRTVVEEMVLRPQQGDI